MKDLLKPISLAAAIALPHAHAQALPQPPRTLATFASGPLLWPVADTSYKIGSLVIEAPWARATPGGAKVAGGYFKIRNVGKEPDRLIGGSLPIAQSVEVHETSMVDGVMKMRRLANGLEIKPGQTVELKPGSYHVMFTGLKGGLKEGESTKGTLVFEKAGAVEIEYRVAPVGAPSGKAH